MQNYTTNPILYCRVNKVQLSRYRPGVTPRVPGSYRSQISWQRHRELVRLSALGTGRIFPQEILLILISVRGWVDPRDIVRSEGLCQWKIPITPSGIQSATFWFVAEHLNLYCWVLLHTYEGGPLKNNRNLTFRHRASSI